MATKQDDTPKNPRAPKIESGQESSFEERTQETVPFDNERPENKRGEPLIVPEGERRSEEAPSKKEKKSVK